MGTYTKSSDVIHGRNPWLKDPEIDYDMDSEDELAEE